MTKYNPGYYVPAVVKSRDYLVGFLDAVDAIGSNADIDFDFSCIDSQRFNDVLPNDKRRKYLTKVEIESIIDEFNEGRFVREVGVEKVVKACIDDPPPYFEVSCKCGNYHRFSYNSEIPETQMKCEICGRILIDYTGVDDDDIKYDGDFNKSLIGFVDDPESEDED